MHACLAEMRPAGSYTSMASRRSRPFSSSPGTRALYISRDHLGNDGLKSGNDVTPGHACSSGVPSILKLQSAYAYGLYGQVADLKILKISSISESPGNRGLRVHISANMQPTDHMSTPVEYCLPPRRISGARYQRVTTYVRISDSLMIG